MQFLSCPQQVELAPSSATLHLTDSLTLPSGRSRHAHSPPSVASSMRLHWGGASVAARCDATSRLHTLQMRVRPLTLQLLPPARDAAADAGASRPGPTPLATQMQRPASAYMSEGTPSGSLSREPSGDRAAQPPCSTAPSEDMIAQGITVACLAAAQPDAAASWLPPNSAPPSVEWCPPAPAFIAEHQSPEHVTQATEEALQVGVWHACAHVLLAALLHAR